MGNEVNWGDIATWFTGIITLGLFVVGFIQIRTERLSRMKLEKNLEIRRKREQAETIATWIISEDRDGLLIAVLNQSNQPIYQIVVSIVVLLQGGEFSGQPDYHKCITVAPPGLGYIKVVADYHGMHRRAAVEIAFRDIYGVNWVRQANGELIEIAESTVGHYEIVLPANWIDLMKDIPSK